MMMKVYFLEVGSQKREFGYKLIFSLLASHLVAMDAFSNRSTVCSIGFKL